ncbi:MAG: hypothetical protein M0Z36_09625 [Thermaerobacter sp.]|nr:hypothetical protein [Thermaerobacter sp.]
MEKRHGDHFEHAYSYDWQALKNWHRLMQLAHLLNVLTLWSAIGETLQHTYGYRDTIQFLRETWSHRYSPTRFSRPTSFIAPRLRPNLRVLPYRPVPSRFLRNG